MTDNDLSMLIYKRANDLYDKYGYIEDSKEDFAQLCCVLMIENINRYYDSNKSNISTYIYNVLPNIIINYIKYYSTCKNNMFYINNIRFKSSEDKYEYIESNYPSEFNIEKWYDEKQLLDLLDKEEYPILYLEIMYGYPQKYISNLLNMNYRTMRSKRYKEINKFKGRNLRFLLNYIKS